jgi:phosphatidylglycerol---prolipoprotein diacylglyceryl transferase
VFPVINITPGPNVIPGVPIGWYGLGYVIGLAVMLLVSQREAERRGIHPSHIFGALPLVLILALLGGRLYHVIDQWALYQNNLQSIILPPYSGLGLYGGVAGAALGIIIYTRWKGLPLRLGLDSVIAGTLFAQGIARWGNFFNQELYGPPTDLPWGIAIDCAHRVAAYPCSLFPVETTGFHPLFFYESALNILGGFIVLFLSRRYLHRLQPGDLAAFWAIWYGSTRFVLETFREGWNWTVGGIPTAQIVGIVLIIVGVVWIAWNHRPGTTPYDYPKVPAPDPRAGPDPQPAEPEPKPDPEPELPTS